MKLATLPLPKFYSSDHAYQHEYQADTLNLPKMAEEWRRLHGLKPVGSDKPRVHLLIIDGQYDFSFPEGKLYVAGRSGTGALDANRNLAEFVYRYLHAISEVTCTLDSHIPYQVFTTSAHLKEDGTHPDAHTIISAEEYEGGLYRPNPAMARQYNLDLIWLQKQFTYYCQQLEATGKYKLYLWPYHCQLGTNGHRLAGVIEEARFFHAWARGAANLPEIKGGNPLTEHYSVFSPEVTTTWDGGVIPHAQKNTKFLEALTLADYIFMGGLASSHCVKTSIEDFSDYLLATAPDLLKKVYILKDCTAPVVIPNGPDYTDEAEAAFQKFIAAGMHVINSTDELDF